MARAALPVELLSLIFQHISPEENLLSLQLVSRQFRSVANDPLLWREYCLSSFQYWAPRHKLEEKVKSKNQDARTVGWRDLWFERRGTNVYISGHLDAIIESEQYRLSRIEEVCAHGYDAKDFLLKQYRTPDDARDDVLARRYWAMTILNSIHRGMAVACWADLSVSDSQDGLDRGLAAFDMFVLHDQDYDMDWVVRHLDGMAEEFRKEHAAFREWSIRQQALALLRWLRTTKRFRGGPVWVVDNQGDEFLSDYYRTLGGHLVGHALTEEEPVVEPAVASGIYQQLAKRLNLNAQLCSDPNHGYVLVQSPFPNIDLDGQSLTSDRQEIRMYLDPGQTDGESEYTDARLRDIVQSRYHIVGAADVFLQPCSLKKLLCDLAFHLGTYAIVHGQAQGDPSRATPEGLRAGYFALNLEAARYCRLWAEHMLAAVDPHWDEFLPEFLRRIVLAHNEDAWIVKKYLVPRYDQLPFQDRRVGWNNVHEALRVLRNIDNRPLLTNRRYTEDIRKRVLYKVGQVFRHDRYGYIGVINAWSTGGSGPLPSFTYDETDEDTITGGPNRRNRTYYSALRSGMDRVKVAQNNVEIITDPALIPPDLTFMAGKFFKRFDAATCTFVSNIKVQFPDD